MPLGTWPATLFDRAIPYDQAVSEDGSGVVRAPSSSPVQLTPQTFEAQAEAERTEGYVLT